MRDFGGRGGRSSCGESRWCIISGSVGARADRRLVQRVVAVFALAVSVLCVQQVGVEGTLSMMSAGRVCFYIRVG